MYGVSNGRISAAPVAQSTNLFAVGSTPSVSANGSSGGIVWALERKDSLDVKPGHQPAVLYAYDATDVSKMIYTSAQVAQRDQTGCANKFQTPTIANGKVYVATQNELDVFGLLGHHPPTPGVFLPNPCYTFPKLKVGEHSVPKSLVLTNSGKATLKISSIAITGADAGDFSQTNTCRSRLAAGASCRIKITFSPSDSTPRVGFVTITENAPGSPHNIFVIGRGVASGAGMISPASLAHGKHTLDSASARKGSSVKNWKKGDYTLKSVALTGESCAALAPTRPSQSPINPRAPPP
jgi:hypothetical protein